MSIRPTVSAIEASIMPPIKQFLEERSADLSKKKSSSPEEGTDMLAEAIAIGVAKALSDTTIKTAFGLIVDTNAAAVVPVGALAHEQISIAATAPSVPNPNLSRPY